MKKWSMVVMGTLFIVLLAGCRVVASRSPRIQFSDDVFLKYTYAPAGDCMVHELFDTHVEVSSDGSVRIYCDDFNQAFRDEYPTRTMQLSEEDITALKDAILENDIMSLPNDISTESSDGDYYYLTVYTEEGEHRTGGLNVGKKKFLAVKSLLYGMTEEECVELRNEVSAIQEQGYMEMYNTD